MHVVTLLIQGGPKFFLDISRKYGAQQMRAPV